ncbi:CHAT domain-containing protein [Nocardioides humi]|uniref:CHAT domain-containing protein n=1 Tax=Nocardioides humi TaxID=449461 RepID=A0ABN2ACH4_9ACTN|nr:CHAT domain-containing protein [Nocardioides humi]
MEELLALALEDPEEAGRRAEQVLAEERDPLARSYAHQCLGIVLRDRGHADEALDELRRGLRAARRSSSAHRESDVRATYGATLVFAGRTHLGLAQLDRALATARGEVRAKALMRKAGVLAILGRHREARPVLRDALDEMELEDDPVWEGRTRIWLGHIELALGNIEDAEREVVAAERLLEQAGATVERLTAVASLADIAVARGDLAGGLGLYADAVAGFEAAHRSWHEIVELHVGAYLAAGLAGEAVSLLDRSRATAELNPYQIPEFALLRATALLAAGGPVDAADALGAAGDARVGFRRQDRRWYELRARLVAVRAREALGDRRGLAPEARLVAVALHADHADEAPVALTLAGGLARGPERLTLWEQAASYRRHPNALVRAGAWHARALARAAAEDRSGVLRAAGAGLDAIDEHRRLIGSSELRALATTHGRELTAVALRHAASDARSLLRWSERTRATALAQPPATSDATTIPASLAALRDNGRRLAEARQEGEPTDGLERERLRLERAVRAEHHTLSAAGPAAADPPSAGVEEIVSGVGDGCLVELVEVDGVLHVLVVHGGRVRRRVAAATEDVAALLGPAAMLLRRAARGRPADMAEVGRRLQEAVLGDAARLIPDGPVVLAPTARLHGLAWSLLPLLHDRPFGVVPSAGQWLRARARSAPEPGSTVLVSGPALASGGAEVPVLASRHPDAVLLDGPRATLDAVLAHLDGAGLVHLAAHGRFRADSPLFSALDLADGPLTVHDLERVRRAPYRVVLSACESGVLAPVGAEELLGLAAALFSLGSAGLVCSVGEVNDAATADLMVGLHAALAAGSDPATALRDVRRAAAGDPVAAGTAAAFLTLGV